MSEIFDWDKGFADMQRSEERKETRKLDTHAFVRAVIDAYKELQVEDFDEAVYSELLYRLTIGPIDREFDESERADMARYLELCVEHMYVMYGELHDFDNQTVTRRKLSLAADYVAAFGANARPLLDMMDHVNPIIMPVAKLEDWEIMSADMNMNRRNAERERIYRIVGEEIHEILDARVRSKLMEWYGYRDSFDQLAEVLVQTGVDLAVAESEKQRATEFRDEDIDKRKADVLHHAAVKIAHVTEQTGNNEDTFERLIGLSRQAALLMLTLLDELFKPEDDEA